MGFFELQHPFFRPVWRRWALIAFCFGWAIFEFVIGSPFWGIIFAAFGAVAVWQFFLIPWSEEDNGKH